MTKQKKILQKLTIVLLLIGVQLFPQSSPNAVMSGVYESGNYLTTGSEALVVATKSYLELGIVKDLAPFEKGTTQVQFTIETFDAYGVIQQTVIRNLSVTQNLSDDSSTSDKVVRLETSYGIRATIQSISYTPEGTGTTIAGNPGNVYVKVSNDNDVIYPLSGAPTSLAIVTGANNTIDFSWGEVSGAKEYELEWTWVDSYKTIEYGEYGEDGEDGEATSPTDDYQSASAIPFTILDFKDNNTRIQTAETSYSISNVYDAGYLMARVRAVGRFLSLQYKDHNKYSDWFSLGTTANPLTVEEWKHIPITSHDDSKKNWQFQSSFAEEGKKKEVVSYFDGTLRNRQTVTKINSDDNTIVGEVIYDAQGRPAIEVLPVPSDDKRIKFNDNFNLNSAGLPYTYLDFDKDTPDSDETNTNCVSRADSMSNTIGASKYYSNTTEKQNNHQDFVPDANGYPFSQIEYTSDNTGRINRKSGVGEKHQLGSGHEMKYYYTTPSIKGELTRLFGSQNVGNILHYKKNIVIDPNKQASVSYIDAQGKTIATALVGDAPANLEGLDDEKEANLHKTITGDVLNNITTSSYTPATLDDTLLSAKQIISIEEGQNFTFDYKVEQDSIFSPLECPPDKGGKAFNYVYDVAIALTNSCGEDSFSETFQVGSTDTDTDTVGFSIEKPYEDDLPIDAYTLTKKLTVSETALNVFADDYIAQITDPNNACYVDPADFAPNVDVKGCLTVCQLCIFEYGIEMTIYYKNGSSYDEYDSVKDYIDAQNEYVKLGLEAKYSTVDITFTYDANYETYTNDLSWNTTEKDIDIFAIKQNELWLIEEFNENTTYDYTDEAYTTAEGIYVITNLNDYFELTDQNGFSYSNENLVIPNDYQNQETLITNLEATYNQEFKEGVSACEAPCNTAEMTFDGCDISVTMLLSDMSPNGQYGLYGQFDDQTDNDYVIVTNPLSIFNENNGLPNEGTTYTWRNPLYYHQDDVSDPARYYDAEGKPSKIYVTLNDEGIYEPAVLDGVTVQDANSSNPWIYPQQLADVQDFIDLWENTWAHSLLPYHPEYEYYKYASALCELTSEVFILNALRGETLTQPKILNSDEFDSYVSQIDSFENAVKAGFFEGNNNLLDRDPYFNNTLGIFEGNSDVGGSGRKEMMRYAIEDRYEYIGGDKNPLNMLRAAYASVVSSGISTDPDADDKIFSIDLDDLIDDELIKSDAIKNRIWQTYRSYYFSLKEKIKYVLLSQYANNQGKYNYCIGDTTGNARDYGEIFEQEIEYKETNFWGRTKKKTKDVPIYGDPQKEIIDYNKDATNDYCDDNSEVWETKIKRFVPIDALYDSENEDQSTAFEEAQEDGAYHNYVETGVCPLALDLEYFLNEVVSDDVSTETNNVQIDFANVNVNAFDGTYRGQYITNTVFEFLGGVSDEDMDYVIASEDKTMRFSIQELQICELRIPENSSLTWATYTDETASGWNIIDFSNVYYKYYTTETGETTYEYNVLANIREGTNTFREVIFTGSTKLAIGECTINLPEPVEGSTAETVGVSLGDGGTYNVSYLCETECENPTGEDDDQDGVDNSCDNCPDTYNPGQLDYNGNGIGNACDTIYPCENGSKKDDDGDFYDNTCDNCPTTYNPDQGDDDGDGIGNLCDPDYCDPNAIVYIPDANFKAYLLGGSNIDSNRDGEIQVCEAETTYSITCRGLEITDLTGIEAFINISILWCQNNELTNLDLSNNTNLRTLICSNNNLESLNISNSQELTSLSCDFNKLTSLDVSKKTNLQYLICRNNNIENLDLSNNQELTSLWCGNNPLRILEVFNNTKLTSFECNNNILSNLDISINKELVRLNCGGNSLSSIDVSNNTNLYRLLCYSNDLTSLDVSNNIELGVLSCGNNKLVNLDVSKNVLLNDLDCGTNLLTNLDVSTNIELEDLECDNNSLESLDVSNNIEIKILKCNDNLLAGIDLSYNGENLDYLDCSTNNITFLDVSKNTNLIRLWCNQNLLTNLDLSKNTRLTSIKCEENKLISLNLKNGVSRSSSIEAINNPNLVCVEVDNSAYPYPGAWEVDAGVTFSEDCSNEATTTTFAKTAFTTTTVVTKTAITSADDILPDDINFETDLAIPENLEEEEEEPKCKCIPQQVYPISCTDQYQKFIEVLGIDAYKMDERRLDSISHPNFSNDPDYTLKVIETNVTGYYLPDNYINLYYDYSTDDVGNDYDDGEQYFCAMNFAFLIDDYEHYLNNIVGEVDDEKRSITNRYFIDIATFGNTYLNYGYDNMESVIDEYGAYIASQITAGVAEEDIENWNLYVDDVYRDLHNVCPPKGMAPTDLEPIETRDICTSLAENLINTYASENYLKYLAQLREDFKRGYIQGALSTVTEELNMSYSDKEYQYTLYYYDQAGNLVQTVPPKGVDRVEQVEGETVKEPEHTLKTQYKYNSLNQLVWQKTPDGGETRFAYDALGRIIASQNAKQFEDYTMSYTKYDALGRIVEAGEVQETTNYTISDLGKLLLDNAEVDTLDKDLNRVEVTQTVYDSFDETLAPITQENLRNRVAVVTYYKEYETDYTNFDDYTNALFYSYDVHGNVYKMATKINDEVLASISQDTKIIEYDYDLISGNVNTVTYQKGGKDQFIHKYEYDEDNRIEYVQTSQDGIIWSKDADYTYYEHGPLARTVIGDKQVQGMDYVYTLQGWLKGVNGEALSSTQDFGKDGEDGENKNVAKDAYGYSLSYFEGDYTPRQNSLEDFFTVSTGTEPTVAQNPKDLYNGNIKSMVTNMQDLKNNPIATAYNHYGYDQLNRIKTMNANIIDGASVKNILTSYSYDKNGNLDSLKRQGLKDGIVLDMDDFTYHYDNGNNQLTLVNDSVDSNNFMSDLDDQEAKITTADSDTHNYVYDQIGQLIEDKAEGITNIDWRVDGKVAQIEKTIDANYSSKISFEYDGLGNRISKTVEEIGNDAKNTTTYYIRDAQGNVMAVYKKIKEATQSTSTFSLEEQHIYGSSRLGVFNNNIVFGEATETTLYTNDFSTLEDLADDNSWLKLGAGGDATIINEQIAVTSYDEKQGVSYFFLTNPGQEYTVYYDLGINTSGASINVKTTVFGETLASQNHTTSNLHSINFTATGAVTKVCWGRINEERDVDNEEYWTLDNIRIITPNYSNSEEDLVDYEIQENLYLNNQNISTNTTEKAYNSITIANTDPYTITNNAVTSYTAGNSIVLSPGFETEAGITAVFQIEDENTNNYQQVVGKKRYELSNHLGNVISVISDRKLLDYGVTYETVAEAEDLMWEGPIEFDDSGVVLEQEIDQKFYSSHDFEPGSYKLEFNFQNELDDQVRFAILTQPDPYNLAYEKLFDTPVSGTTTATFSINDYTVLYLVWYTEDESDGSIFGTLENFTIDKVIQNEVATSQISYQPEIIAYNDYYPFGMLMPNRHGQADSYRYGFNGMEADDEVKGEGNSYDFGARMLDPRIGRWFSTDNIKKPWLSQYQFSSNDPINYVDPDGNDEIHFYYYVTPTLTGKGEIINVLTLSAEIIENEKEHTFFMHAPSHLGGDVTQFFPFREDRTPSNRTAAVDANLPLSSTLSTLYFFDTAVDDNAFLGTLLKSFPELDDHYKGKREDGMRFRNAKSRASSAELTGFLNDKVEIAYAILDGYYLYQGAKSLAVRQLAKNSLNIAKPSFAAITGQVAKLTINKNSNEAIGHFVLYEVFDKKTKEILKVGIAKAEDVMANGSIRRAHESARLARKEGFTDATFRIVEDLGITSKGAGKVKEAARVVKHRKAGKELPLNRERSKAYQVK